MNNGILPAHLICASDQFGDLEKAGAFVYRDFEPADEPTKTYVVGLLGKIGLNPKGDQITKKYVRCLSDFLMAVRTTITEKVAWSGAASEFQSKPYGYDVAKSVRDALIDHGEMVLVQKSSKKDGLTRLYKISPEICPTHLRFKQHGEGPLVSVKSKKVRKGGKVTGGLRMGRAQFQPSLKTLEKEVAKINFQMLLHPLCGADGTEYVRCYRIFNNGSLKAGGRLYGRWQNKPEVERLAMTIDGDPVCEIDIKASFLSIAYAGTRTNQRLATDPYMMIKFVAEAGENIKIMRTVGKLLVNAYLCKEGELTQFPKGDRKGGKTISFRKKYGLKHDVQHYMGQIHAAFPFLKGVKQDGFGLMYQESQIMIGAMQELMSQGIVSYPVHDCLLVKKSDQDAATKALEHELQKNLGYIPTMDVSWLDDDGSVQTTLINDQDEEDQILNSLPDDFEQTSDDDFDLFDDVIIDTGSPTHTHGLSL